MGGDWKMADVLLFHHALGLTKGIQDFADQLRGESHTVHVRRSRI